ncbi:MAG: hypothetical protein PHH09_04700 [Methanoregulaceae archaeon]|nr:hypothetical protein [Methanoregulaceae archaeon]
MYVSWGNGGTIRLFATMEKIGEPGYISWWYASLHTPTCDAGSAAFEITLNDPSFETGGGCLAVR